MRAGVLFLIIVILALTSGSWRTRADEPLVVGPILSTAPLLSYEDAPATPDADDPAIWIDRRNPRQSLVIGTAKDAGLLVYDLEGRLVQAIRPPNAPQVLPIDPPTPAGINLAPEKPCLDSERRDLFDRTNKTLYVAFETIGLYKLPLRESLPSFVAVGVEQLIEPVTTFGVAYLATPDDDEFECAYEPESDGSPESIPAPGSQANAGQFLSADLEGLSIVASVPGNTLMLASSQGDSSFHFYLIGRDTIRHEGVFFVEGVGDTDGVHYVPVAINPRYPLGLLVVQNGEAPEPHDTEPVNGYEFDGATQFKYLSFLDTLKSLSH